MSYHHEYDYRMIEKQDIIWSDSDNYACSFTVISQNIVADFMRVENNNKYSMFNDTRFYKTHYDFPHLFIVKEWLI